MRSLHVTLAFVVALGAAAQLDTSFTMDVLRAPSSPGSVLLGVAEADIQRPTDPVDFTATIRQATNDFTQLPKNFAIDLAPALIWGKPRSAAEILGLGKDYKPIKDTWNRVGNNIAQTFAISFAVKDLGTDGNEEESVALNDPQTGIGFKFSIFRGTATTGSAKQLEQLGDVMAEIALEANTIATTALLTDVTYQQMLTDVRATQDPVASAALAQKAVDYGKKVVDDAVKKDLEAPVSSDPKLNKKADIAHERAGKFKMEREGFFWDLAGGMVLDYVDRRLDNSYITKAGLWTSLGNNSKKTNITYQVQLRYLFQPDNAFMGEADTLELKDIHLADGGARFSWDPNDGRFSFSLEALYRVALNVDAIDPTWRLVTNADYDLGNNRRLGFSFGRNFDGTTSKSGNLIAALNLVLGFGHKNSTRQLTPP
jgi:hypothetical protein